MKNIKLRPDETASNWMLGIRREYRVEWSMFFEAENPLDAAKQAWAALDDATSNNSGASILFVSDEYGEDRFVFDMEHENAC